MNQRNPVILCVDDEEANRKLLEHILVPRGYAVVSAASGKDALLKIKSQAIDLVLLDVIMPGMDGFEACRQIKEDQKLRDIPVILVTALSAKQDHIRGIEVGADEFLSKPIEKTMALARIKILLKVKELNDERKRAESQREAALEALQKAHDELDRKVRERTAELAQANEMLKADIIKREQIEETLRKSEENFRLSLEDSPLGVCIATAKGETILANKALLDIYGHVNIEELNAIPLKERYTPQSYAEFQIRKKARDQGNFGPSQYEINIVRKNGEIRHLLVLRKEILWDGTKQFQVIYQDITERKQAEEKIRNSLAEKDVLLKEVHHRVKNNLMIIIGLIKMEETKADNEMFNHLLQELERRIRSMAQVHEGFYKSTDLAHIDLQNYIETMGAQISAQFGADRNIRFSVQAVGVKLGLDIAVPCGLILNELITNAYKHAFPGDKPRAGEDNCEIKVIVEQEGGVLTLTVANNGVGLPADLDVEKSETLGLRLIKMLTQQINGSIELDRSAGTAYRLKFSMAV